MTYVHNVGQIGIRMNNKLNICVNIFIYIERESYMYVCMYSFHILF